MGQAMTEYEARHGNVAPRPVSHNGIAKVVLACRCGTTVELELYAADYESECHGHYDFDAPDGWYIDIDSLHGDKIVRCPKHRTVV